MFAEATINNEIEPVLYDRENQIYYGFDPTPEHTDWHAFTEEQKLLLSFITFANYKMSQHNRIGAGNANEDEEYELDYNAQRIWFAPDDDAYLIPALGETRWDGHIFVAGMTGAGKSWLAKEILLSDSRQRPVYLFSDLQTEDPSLSRLRARGRMRSSNDFHWQPNVITMFDDVRNEEMQELRDKILEQGRHSKVSALCVTHQLKQWSKTKTPLTDSRWIVVFPTANYAIVNNFLKENFDLHTNIRKYLLRKASEDGRYMLIHRFAPNFLATQKFVYRL